MRKNPGTWVLLVVALLAASACTEVREQPTTERHRVRTRDPLRSASTHRTKPTIGKVPLGSPAERAAAKKFERQREMRQLAAASRLNDDPDGLRREDLQKALDASMGTLAGCFDGSDANSAGVFFEADPSGIARGIQVRGVPPATAACIQKTVASLKFPEFHGNPVPIDFPLSVHRRTVERPAEGDKAVTASAASGGATQPQ
jgi:HAMP domain-containing protein